MPITVHSNMAVGLNLLPLPLASNGLPAMHCAVGNEHVDTVRVLLDAKARVNT